MQPNRRVLALGFSALLLAPASGCATRGQVRDLEARVDTHEKRLDALEQRVADAANTADEAVRRAEAAEASARAAADKADAIFRKSVRK